MKKFTLLELLIVIAVIGILLTLLLPSLQKARHSAKLAVCASNLSQISKAAFAYHNHNDRFPRLKKSHIYCWIGKTGSQHNSGGSLGTTKRDLNKYLGDFDSNSEVLVAKCPETETYGQDLYEIKGSNYGGNVSNLISNTLHSVPNLAKINDPSRMILINEHGAYRATKLNVMPEKFFLHYNERRFNASFIDGSVKINMIFMKNLYSTEEYTFNNNL